MRFKTIADYEARDEAFLRLAQETLERLQRQIAAKKQFERAQKILNKPKR